MTIKSIQSAHECYIVVKAYGGDNMPIIPNQSDSKLKLVLNAGYDENNKAIIKNKTYANIKSTVTDEDLYGLGAAISDLQSYSLLNLVRYEESELINEII